MLLSFSQGAELFLLYIKLVYHDSSYCCCHQLCQALTRRREFPETAKKMFLLGFWFFFLLFPLRCFQVSVGGAPSVGGDTAPP